MGKVISFGYSKRALTPKADRVVDVRSFGHDLDSPAVTDLVELLCKDYTEGQTVAVGCDKGEHRSVEIARRIAAKLHLKLQHRDKK